VPASPETLEQLLEQARRELLDLSTRNRLLDMPVESKSARVIHVRDEKSDPVFRLLVNERRAFSFQSGLERKPRGDAAALAAGADEEEETGLPQPDDETDAATGEARRHLDTKLQTALTSKALQRRLLSLHRDARLMIEEQGVNILYLALGRLKWFEVDKANVPRHAPLILVPVQLERRSASERFTLAWREEEVQENLSLVAKLKTDFGITLPEFTTEEELVPSRYAAAVSRAVAGRPGWEVQPDAMTLRFFSFAKFLIFRDLDPENWPKPKLFLDSLSPLLRDGFPSADRPFPDEAHLDEVIPAARLDHVVDADSSQTVVIEWVRAGRSLVIQGPPGTGKSQSITNIIATAVLDGKKVLFVAEKLAALEVVKRRLEAVGLGDLCLELHSHKAHKRAVLEEIGRTWQLGRPRGQELESLVPRLDAARARLNGHVRLLHTPLGDSGTTPFRILGVLARLGERGRELGDLDLAGAEGWSADELRERREVVADLARRVEHMGTPAGHPWRGVERETVLNIDLARIREMLERLQAALAPVRDEARSLAARLRQSEPPTFAHLELLRRMAAHVAAAPALDPSALCHSVWNTGLDGLRGLIEHGRAFAALRAKLAAQVSDTAFETDLSTARAAVVAHGRSLFRILNGEFRRGIAALRGVLRGELPKTHDERVTLLDDLITARKHLLAVRAAAETGRQAFGSAWHDEESDWAQLDAIVEWVAGESAAGVDAGFRQTFAELERREDVATLVAALEQRLSEAWTAIQALAKELALDPKAAFGCERLEDIPLADLATRLSQWFERLEDLTRWNTWYVRATRARELGLSVIVKGLESGRLPPHTASGVFERAYHARLLRETVRARPELAKFDGLEHERLIEEFRQLDRERLRLAKYRVLARHYDNLPSRHAGAGATGVLLGELERKRGHRPIRKLLKDAGPVIQAIKPVFMMSPHSVAQFLEPGAVEFDLLVIDEASQVQPVDALGAFARARQHVVVGDAKQLPPTRFFNRLTGNEDETAVSEEEMPAAQAQDVESILGLCCARGLPETMLRWHYRSRHHTLIAVSNREFYEDKLFIVPSPLRQAEGLGLVFHFVEGGVYDRGGSATNPVEARAVCRAVLEYARRHPNLSLGVAAFSVRQQQAILDELELLRREQPELENFVHAHPHEPFFVKNLENVQGDERDVIFISTGYGPDASGYVAMNFGPLSAEGGERRLNVLISRAKLRCEVFASLRAEDIDLARASGRGVRAFKTFLQFAETGRLVAPAQSVGEEMSPFEEAVRRAVEGLGFEVHPQVGVAGFFVDLGVVDPEKPSRYVLGIECDGATYHAARSARDRDRLRQAVLEDHGWIIHRIWSTDWFQRPDEQLRKVAAVIEQARRKCATHPDLAPQVAKNVDDEPAIEREDVAGAEAEELSAPYVEAAFPVPTGVAPHELPSKQMADVVFRLVEAEGPIHEDEVTARVRDLWGLGRTGSRVQDSVARAVRLLLTSQRCRREDGCLFLPGAPMPVRDRTAVRSPSLRKPDLLPPQEVRAAIEKVIAAHHGASAADIVRTVSRLLGFQATSTALRKIIGKQIEREVKSGRIHEFDGVYHLCVEPSG
jgi:very-short-patch-repair endonuclease